MCRDCTETGWEWLLWLLLDGGAWAWLVLSGWASTRVLAGWWLVTIRVGECCCTVLGVNVKLECRGDCSGKGEAGRWAGVLRGGRVMVTEVWPRLTGVARFWLTRRIMSRELEGSTVGTRAASSLTTPTFLATAEGVGAAPVRPPGRLTCRFLKGRSPGLLPV